MTAKEREHAFSIELTSKRHLKSAKVGVENGRQWQVFIEGFLGELSELKLVEESMLEVRGANGTLRLDVTSGELQMLMKKMKGGRTEE